MRVTTPIADMEITVDRITVEGGTLVMTNGTDDAMQARTVMGPQDVRRIFGALLRPRVIWFALTCQFRRDETAEAKQSAATDTHPTPNPW